MIETWHGYYKYNNQKIQKAVGFDKTYFTITTTSSDGKIFHGTVVDDIKTGGMEGIGKIIGTIDGSSITFEKYMPKKSTIYPNGEHKYSDEKHPTIYYKGIISEDRLEATGKWKFKITIVFLFGIIPIPYRPAKGTWSMKFKP